MDNRKTGRFIAQLRKEKMLTQEQLAERLGVTNRSISRWENGSTLPDLSVLKLLCMELDTSIEELLCGNRLDHRVQWLDGAERLLKLLEETQKEKSRQIAAAFGLGVCAVALALIWLMTAQPDSSRLGLLIGVGISCFAVGFYRNSRHVTLSRRELQALTGQGWNTAMTSGGEMLQYARKLQKASLKQYRLAFDKIADTLEPGEYALFSMVAESYAINQNPGPWHVALAVTNRRLLLCGEGVRGRLLTHYTPEWFLRKEIQSVHYHPYRILIKTETGMVTISGNDLEAAAAQLTKLLK